MRDQYIEHLIKLSRRMQYVAVVVALAGGLVGWATAGVPRTVIWTTSWVLAVWLLAAAFLQASRYRQPLAATRSSGAGTRLRDVDQSFSQDSAGMSRQRAALENYARVSMRATLLSALMLIVGIVGGVELNGPAKLAGIVGTKLSATSEAMNIAQSSRCGP